MIQYLCVDSNPSFSEKISSYLGDFSLLRFNTINDLVDLNPSDSTLGAMVCFIGPSVQVSSFLAFCKEHEPLTRYLVILYFYEGEYIRLDKELYDCPVFRFLHFPIISDQLTSVLMQLSRALLVQHKSSLFVSSDSPSKNILVVDDEKENCHHYRLFLEKEYEIFSAESMGDAVSILSSESIDMVLLDIGLPDAQGFSLFDTEVSLAYKTMIVSAYAQPLYLKKAFKYGVYDYLTKPFLKRTLCFLVQRFFYIQSLSTSVAKKLEY